MVREIRKNELNELLELYLFLQNLLIFRFWGRIRVNFIVRRRGG